MSGSISNNNCDSSSGGEYSCYKASFPDLFSERGSIIHCDDVKKDSIFRDLDSDLEIDSRPRGDDLEWCSRKKKSLSLEIQPSSGALNQYLLNNHRPNIHNSQRDLRKITKPKIQKKTTFEPSNTDKRYIQEKESY